MTAPAGTQKILELKDVHTYYGSIHALKGVTLDVMGESTSVAPRKKPRTSLCRGIDSRPAGPGLAARARPAVDL